MTERPILFSGPMVRAILDGRKTQTRRVIVPQPPTNEYGDPYSGRVFGPEWYEPAIEDKFGALIPGKPVFGVYDEDGEWGAKVRFIPGDHLWVRETWSHTGIGVWTIAEARMADNGHPIYAADGGDGPWWPSIHMPREFSRITLIVTDVRVQRLQDIEPVDAECEGVQCDMSPRTFIDHFHNLWDRLNARRGFGWDVNPWVVAASFERSPPICTEKNHERD